MDQFGASAAGFQTSRYLKIGLEGGNPPPLKLTFGPASVQDLDDTATDGQGRITYLPIAIVVDVMPSTTQQTYFRPRHPE